MFPKFKKRPLHICRDESLEVILVSNKRVGRKVEQKCIKYLGSVRLSRFDADWRLTKFWTKVDKSFATLDLPDNIKNSFKEKILTRIPMPEEMRNQDKEQPPLGVREEMQLKLKRLKRG